MAVVECHRFLHSNYNCRDTALLTSWYGELFGLRPVMASTSEGAPGDPFGIYQPTSSSVVFLYDHRGGRRATSLELVAWTQPATFGSPYPVPWSYGIHSYGFSVPDVGEVARRAEALGSSAVKTVEQGLLLRDPEGLPVEVVGGAGDRAEAHHMRLVCADLNRSVDWYENIGMKPAPHAVVVAGNELWDGDAEHTLEREVGVVAADDPTYSLILSSWTGPPPIGPSYAMPFHQGLYRMAIAVDDVHAAYESLRGAGIAKQPPYTFILPGTPLTNGLTILFIRDPDGVLVELVERPRSEFPS
jgi:catechol 2,3-dioxygenase-like lactoylglutathione lyase family enzyme